MAKCIRCGRSGMGVLHQAIKLKDKNIRFIKAASHEFDHDSEYDVITAVQSHHYYRPDERARAVSNCYRALRNGGIFITFENIRMSSETSELIVFVLHFL